MQFYYDKFPGAKTTQQTPSLGNQTSREEEREAHSRKFSTSGQPASPQAGRKGYPLLAESWWYPRDFVDSWARWRAERDLSGNTTD